MEARVAMPVAYLGHIASGCGGLCTVKIVKDDEGIETQRIRAQRVAKDFYNILSPSTLPLETLLVGVAVLRM